MPPSSWPVQGRVDVLAFVPDQSKAGMDDTAVNALFEGELCRSGL
jgi:hypothetical protein